MAHSIALAELISYLEDSRVKGEVKVHKLSSLVKDYSVRLTQLGADSDQQVHATRLKNRLTTHIPELRAISNGREVLLSFDEEIGDLLSDNLFQDHDSDAMCLMRAANIVRRDILDHKYCFQGSFEPDCQSKSIPESLNALVRMILEGSSIKNQASGRGSSQAALTIAQLIKFNCVKSRRQNSSFLRHQNSMETPLPLYIGAMIHTRTRKKGLVDRLFDLGISVSYDRVLNVSADLGNLLSNQFEATGIVCPASLRKNVFTTMAVDNIDHNPSSATAADSFHGTTISVVQHPSTVGEGTELEKPAFVSTASKSIKPLPSFYTNVSPVAKSCVQSPTGMLQGSMAFDSNTMSVAIRNGYAWLEQLHFALKEEEVTNSSDEMLLETRMKPWPVFHSQRKAVQVKPKSASYLLPMFPDCAHSVPMIKHSMKVAVKLTDHANPGQTPVLVCDQPLFALAKQIQWTWPEELGEDHFMVMMGGLHVEMAILAALGSFLDNSGWTEALVLAQVTTSGRAQSLLSGSKVKRTRYAHLVTLGALSLLQQDSYRKYLTSVEGTEALQFLDWCCYQASRSPQFDYWNTVKEIQIQIIIFIRSLRESNFELYCSSLNAMAKWFFALDRTNYARWISVHLKDLLELKMKHPGLHEEFENGKFTAQRTANSFSAMALDQAHEQLNSFVKGDGGAVGLTENPSALLRWMVSGPEMARIISEFESCSEDENGKLHPHHENSSAHTERFNTDIRSLLHTMKELGNPFEEEGDELVSLVSKDIVSPDAVLTLKKIKATGESQFNTFVEERLRIGSIPLNEAIPRNKFSLFGEKAKRNPSKNAGKLKTAKQDTRLFARLYIGCQFRDGDLEDFFAHENQSSPPAISENGKLQSGTKSDLIQCLMEEIDTEDVSPKPTCVILDGAVLVQMLRPKNCKTFKDYSTSMFLPHLKSWLQKAQRVDLVWDDYFECSLKASSRESRGRGQRRRVLSSAPLPTDWQAFLRLDENKKELFAFLSIEAGSLETEGTELVFTLKEGVVCYPARETLMLAPCSHEEADTRMMVHVADAAASGYSSILIRTVDTDVVALAVAVFGEVEVSELWIMFGTGKNQRMLPIHEIAKKLGQEKSQSLPLFHALTGCDTTSFFLGHGKKRAWTTWENLPDLTKTLLNLQKLEGTSEVPDQCIQVIERFIVLLYDRTSMLSKV